MGSPEEGGALLKELMKEHRYRAKDLAERLDVSISSVRAWQAGSYAPRDEHAEEAAWWLLGEDGHKLLDAWGLERAAHNFRAFMRSIDKSNEEWERLHETLAKWDEVTGKVKATQDDNTAQAHGFSLPPEVHLLYYTGQDLTDQNQKLILGIIALLQQTQPGASWHTASGSVAEAEAAAQEAYETAMGNQPEGDEEANQ